MSQTQTLRFKTVKLNPVIHKELKKLSVEKETTIEELVAISTELLLELASAGYIPDDLGYFLERRNPELLRKLADVMR